MLDCREEAAVKVGGPEARGPEERVALWALDGGCDRKEMLSEACVSPSGPPVVCVSTLGSQL